MDLEQVKSDLVRDEGLRLKVYRCTAGKLTIGIGRNIDDRKFSQDEIDFLVLSNTTRRDRLLVNNTNRVTSEQLVQDVIKFGITEEEALYLLESDISICIDELTKSIPWYKSKSDNIKRVLINMCFNVGIVKLLTFKKTLGLIKESKYKEASVEMLNSKWAKDVGKRAIRLSNIVANEV